MESYNNSLIHYPFTPLRITHFFRKETNAHKQPISFD